MQTLRAMGAIMVVGLGVLAFYWGCEAGSDLGGAWVQGAQSAMEKHPDWRR